MNMRTVFGILIVILGIGFLFDINVGRFLIAILFVVLGVRILMGRPDMDLRQRETRENFIRRVMVFTGINQKVQSTEFKGAELVVVLGGGELDLSEVTTKSKTVELELVAVLGGLRVKAPRSWHVESEGIGILGGFTNETSPKNPTVTAKLKGVAVLGGVEVTN